MSCDFASEESCSYCNYEGWSLSIVAVFVVLLKSTYVTCISLSFNHN